MQALLQRRKLLPHSVELSVMLPLHSLELRLACVLPCFSFLVCYIYNIVHERRASGGRGLDGHDASIDETRDAVVLCVAKAGAVFGAGFRSLGLGVGVRVWV